MIFCMARQTVLHAFMDGGGDRVIDGKTFLVDGRCSVEYIFWCLGPLYKLGGG